MAGSEVKRRRTHERHGETKASKFRRRSEDDRATTKSIPATAADRSVDIEALRKARLDHLSSKEMPHEYVKRTITVSHRHPDKEKHHKVLRDQTTEREPPKPSGRSSRRTNDDRQRSRREHNEDDYVYSRRTTETDSTDAKPRTKVRESSPAKRADRPRTSKRSHTEPLRRQKSHDEVEENREEHVSSAINTIRLERVSSRRRSEVERTDTFPRRSSVSGEKAARPPLKRSATTTVSRTVVSNAPSQPHTKAPSLFSGFLSPNSAPARKVPCLTCGDDDVPITHSAKLPCTHRMCHSCLKRIFTMSVKDPAHMPPRCCTDQHIDLKHVDKLFDQKFKVLWNRKYSEFKTKNRIYCPARKCGAWIKPSYITKENGRKVGRCKQCKTRVCGICSQKMHSSRDCPKDPETKAFVEVAKEKGWQRCYSCSAMVELKEGCNHMTCRCTAEFCMVCGLKWKSCDCPWFNYEAVDAHLGDPLRYQQEMERRRDQEQRDEALARRMQRMGLGNAVQDDGYGVGNAANHHMNQNFIQQAREALTANYANAEQAARGLINGFVMGRENRLPGIPSPMDQTMDMLGQAPRPARDPAEEDADVHDGRRPVRRVTARRRNVVGDGDGGHHVARETDQERRMRAWADSVPAYA
ncbi:hypothetical protein EDD36DRAFT_65338 [Exophiala viscosa]|uniref:RBR-type E3 ubiquitin transferase n=1 Tax=Exophiala viscosa TaxID=2486360 RepID=A0AAN6DMD0_9EURO|nr:hypothetical protein EDD36DRAFT_65338 [Exophiala viscosa]